jgi:hypothetical protein
MPDWTTPPHQKVHGVSNATVTSIANAIKASRPGWSAGGVFSNTHGLISAA